MTDPHEQMLEHELERMTTWTGPAPQVWRKALDAGGAKSPGRFAQWLRGVVSWPRPRLIAACALLIAIVCVAIAIVGQPFRADRVVAMGSATTESLPNLKSLDMARQGIAGEWTNRQFTITKDDVASYLDLGAGGGGFGGGAMQTQAGMDASSASMPAKRTTSTNAGASAEQPSRVPDGADRQVVRKATMELATDDVRGAFLKAQHLVSEASDEYVQDSSLTGSGKEAMANLTLRVRIDRLAAVLNELRELGKVSSESTTGEDVTAQVVDLDARIRNEQRVEREMLELMEKRTDAPLKDILELRQQISMVRGQIERFIGEQQRLGRLVSLATVLVLIRPQDQKKAEPEVKQQSIGEYFTNVLTDSWDRGLHGLADTLAGALRLLIGGLMWWIIALISVLLAQRYAQHHRQAAGHAAAAPVLGEAAAQ